MLGHSIGETKLTFKGFFEAWLWIYENCPGISWEFDSISSDKAGYRIYRDQDEFYNYVCDLGDRLEVNLKENNQTINLWLEDEEEIPEIKANTYKVEFNDVELILVKGALYRLSTSFNELDVVNGNSSNLNASITCLELINRINCALNKKD